MRFRISHLAFSCAVFCCILSQSKAVLTINVREVGDDVVVTYAGSLSLQGLAYRRSTTVGTQMSPYAGFVVSCPDGELVDEYEAPRPVNFPYFGEDAPGHTNFFIIGDSSEGTPVGFGNKEVFVGKGYQSNAPLSGTSVYSGASLSSLKLKHGIYTAALPSDVMVMVIGSGLTSQSAAPDPSPEPDPEPDPSPDPDPVIDPEPASNSIVNGGFEASSDPWTFFTNAKGTGELVSPGYGGSSSAFHVQIITKGNNTQFFQNDITLEPNKEYQLTFAAYSNTGRDLRVAVGKHSSPFTNYGLNRIVVDLSKEWKVYTITFTTVGFDTEVDDARIYFWFSSHGRSGDEYFVDDISLSIKE